MTGARASIVANLVICALLVTGVVALLLFSDRKIVAQTRPPPKVECATDEDRIQVRKLLLEAIDEGLKDHTKRLFDGWLKDPTHQPERAQAGMQSAIIAYQQARHAALAWSPPNC